MTIANPMPDNNFKIIYDILDTIISFTFGLLMGVWIFLNNVINYCSDKLFIAWDYVMEKTNRKQIVHDLDNDQYAINYFILFSPTFKSYFNLVVCKINKTDGLDNHQFKNIITFDSSIFDKWYFLLLNRKLCVTNEDKSNVTIHKPGFYIKSNTLRDDCKNKMIVNDPIWGIVLHYDVKNKKN